MTNNCCDECGKEGGASLKVCKSCMQVKYCNAECQRQHWSTHKKQCRLRAAELRDEALFKDPPHKEDCPICFLPMPVKLLCCTSLPAATILSVPIYDFVTANVELANDDTDSAVYYSCCGKSICGGCLFSFVESGNIGKCPFCKAERIGLYSTDEDTVADMMRRVEANDVGAIYQQAGYYYSGLEGFQQDRAKAMDLYVRAAELGCKKAHYCLGVIYMGEGDLKKAKFHFEAAAIAGHEMARYNLGYIEYNSGNIERAIKHFTIAASAGHYKAMYQLRTFFKEGVIKRESIDSTLGAYNNSCAEMRSKARDAYIALWRLGRTV